MQTSLIDTSERTVSDKPTNVRLRVAEFIVDEVESSILRHTKATEPKYVHARRRQLSIWKSAASLSKMMPTLWLSLCAMVLRDRAHGLLNNATPEQRDYIFSLSDACFCLQSHKPDQALTVLNNLQALVPYSQPGRNTICDCVWDIAHSVRWALFFAARCELGERNGTGPVCAFPLVYSDGPAKLSPIGPVDVLATLASAAIRLAIDKSVDLAGWIAVESQTVNMAEPRAGALGRTKIEIGRTAMVRSFYRHFRKTLSSRK